MVNAAAPSPDYDAALWGAAVGRRPDRRFLGVTGSAPGETHQGAPHQQSPRAPRRGDRRGKLRGGGLLGSPYGEGENDHRPARFPGSGGWVPPGAAGGRCRWCSGPLPEVPPAKARSSGGSVRGPGGSFLDGARGTGPSGEGGGGNGMVRIREGDFGPSGRTRVRISRFRRGCSPGQPDRGLPRGELGRASSRGVSTGTSGPDAGLGSGSSYRTEPGSATNRKRSSGLRKRHEHRDHSSGGRDSTPGHRQPQRLLCGPGSHHSHSGPGSCEQGTPGSPPRGCSGSGTGRGTLPDGTGQTPGVGHECRRLPGLRPGHRFRLCATWYRAGRSPAIGGD